MSVLQISFKVLNVPKTWKGFLVPLTPQESLNFPGFSSFTFQRGRFLREALRGP
jgi:hypothetical protein